MNRLRQLRHIAGSVLIVGLEGTALSALESAWLASLQPAGVILFRRNIEAGSQVLSMFRQIADIVPQPFFRCVDMEGGTVDRLRDLIGPSPAPAEVAATGAPSIYREHGAMIGAALRALGFNVNLAPVLDLALTPALPVLGSRVVSADPAAVGAYASAFLDGLAAAGILGCGKHFPGLGGGTLDSHAAMPAIGRTWEQMWQQDLAPYRALQSRLPMIMVNHAAYPKIEKPARPASLSEFWMQHVLRKRLRYRGLIFSDDMEMGGVLSHASSADAAMAAIENGMDLIEICHRADRILTSHEALLREAEKSIAFRRRLMAAARRVSAMRRKSLAGPIPRSLTPRTLDALRDRQQRLWNRIAQHARGAAR
jgi:beta-N-acetylhexosaminidase